MRRGHFGSKVIAFGALGFIALMPIAALGQPAALPEFEVASVKLLNPPMGGHAVGLKLNHGRVTVEGATLRQIIVQAYVVQRVLVLGGPAWYDSDQYDVVAKTSNPDATREEARAMLETLLADRFKLAVHREKKELTIYSLSVAKNGPKFHEAKPDEAAGVQGGGAGELVFQNQPIVTLVNTLANILDLPVQDMTDLKGRYNFTLDWTRDPTGASLFTAVQEQLGLKLEARKSPVEVLMVDHAERPSEN
jgi:uncharacterized protein (TIGR03435 family)